MSSTSVPKQDEKKPTDLKSSMITLKVKSQDLEPDEDAWLQIFSEHHLLDNTEMHSKRKFSSEEPKISSKRVSVGGRSCFGVHAHLLVECDKVLETLQDTEQITKEVRESAFHHFKSNKDVVDMRVFLNRKVDSRIQFIHSYCVPKT